MHNAVSPENVGRVSDKINMSFGLITNGKPLYIRGSYVIIQYDRYGPGELSGVGNMQVWDV